MACDLGDLASGATKVITVHPTTTGPLLSSAAVTGDLDDPITTNNIVQATVDIPGLSQWGLMVMAGMLVTLALRHRPRWMLSRR